LAISVEQSDSAEVSASVTAVSRAATSPKREVLVDAATVNERVMHDAVAHVPLEDLRRRDAVMRWQ